MAEGSAENPAPEEEVLRRRLDVLEKEVDRLSRLLSGPADSEAMPLRARTRRQVFKLAGASVLGVAAATVLSTKRALATSVPFYLDQANTGTATTSLAAALTQPTLALSSTAGGVALDAIVSSSSSGGPTIRATNNALGGNAIVAQITSGSGSATLVSVTNGYGRGIIGGSTYGYGIEATGGLAPLHMVPASAAGPPTSGTHALGEVYVDSNGQVYKCMAAGSPGFWVPLNAVVPVTPVRVINTTNGTGGLTGPFSAGSTIHTTSVLTGGSSGIPSSALALVGNLSISGNGSLLNGYGVLILFAAGTSVPGVASLTSGAGSYATTNGVTVTLGTGSNAGRLSFQWTGGGPVPPCQVFFDVTGYIA